MRQILLVGWLCGCLNANLNVCSDGRACPAALTCDTIHHTCVTDQQLSVCAGIDDFEQCTTDSITGECFSGVCLVPGCGNGIVEPTETCDDGNRINSDGCSATCRSNETCNNGVLDFGEECDDGNLISHDGCSSACATEAVTLRAYPISLHGGSARVAAYDPMRQRLVQVLGRSTWEWDGTRWEVVSLDSPSANWDSVTYDSDRHTVIAFTGFDQIVAEWSGSAWRTLATTGTYPNSPRLAVYDPTRKRTLLLVPSTDQYSTFDAATGAFSGGTAPFVIENSASAAYDASRDRIVVVTSPTTTWEWNGSSWSSVSAAPPAAAYTALVYDETRGRLVAVGGQVSPSVLSGDLSAWTGTAWTATGATIVPRQYPTAWYVPTSGSLFVHGGANLTSYMVDILEVAGTTVTDRTPTLPYAEGPLAFDPVGDRLLMFDAYDAWSWRDGAWAHVSSSVRPDSLEGIMYDPVRGATLGVDYYGATWIHGQDWQALPVSTLVTATAPVLAYDYAARGIVAVDSTTVSILNSSATTWSTIGTGTFLRSLAFDAVRAGMVGIGFAGSIERLYDFTNDTWTASLSPGTSFFLGESRATGGVLIAGREGLPVWERRGPTWTPLTTAPVSLSDPESMGQGRIAMVGTDYLGAMVVVLERTSATPDEMCGPDDTDGDGAIGCADPDCWQSCNPVCPYASECP